MPLSQPCTTKECMEAATAAMRAQGASPREGPAKGGAEGFETGGAAAAAPTSTRVVASKAGEGSPRPGMACTTQQAPQPLHAMPAGELGGGAGSPTAPGVTTPRGAAPSPVTAGEVTNMHHRRSSASSEELGTAHASARALKDPLGEAQFSVLESAGGRLQAVSSGARWEEVVGYSRAVKRGPFIFVSGTAGVDQASGRVMYRHNAYRQTRMAFAIVERALEAVGASLANVVRTRLFLRDMPRDGEAVSRAHGELLGDVRPASSMVEVSRLVHDDILVLLEVDAVADE